MPSKYNGSILGKKPTVSYSATTGSFDLNRAADEQRNGTWPPLQSDLTADILVIAGGGAGGSVSTV